MDVLLFNLISVGIGLAHICLAKGYKCVIFMPDTQSQVRILMNSKAVPWKNCREHKSSVPMN